LTCTDEVDPYKKPKELLEVSPKGLVPGLRFNRYNPAWSLNESTVILDFLEEYVFVLAYPLASSDQPYSLAGTTTKRSILPPITNPCKSHIYIVATDELMSE
jgi:glutathione S-transferase